MNQNDQNEYDDQKSNIACSRLIIKNLPKHMTEERLSKHFENLNGEKVKITDAKIMRKNGKSRLFGFIGFKNELHAKKALKYFQNTYLDTSKIQLDYAKQQNDESIPRPWSRYTMGSSAYKITHQKQNQSQDNQKKRELKHEEKLEQEEKKRKFREFLKVMGVNNDVQDPEKKKEKIIGGQKTWNDSFMDFMQSDKKIEVDEQKYEEKDQLADQIIQVQEEIEQRRLYVMNLSYDVTHDELNEIFQTYGEIEKIEIPLRKGGKGQSMGVAYINYKDTESAISCFAGLDKTYFQGRKIHILPAEKKPPSEPKPEFEFKKQNKENQENKTSDFKEQKEKTLKLNFGDETNWNYLYMNQDTVAISMAKRLGIDKSKLLDRNQSNIAVRLAQSETLIINETKEWMKNNGIDIDKLESLPRQECKRSHTILLIKNIPYTTKEKDLREIFERYGELQRLILSPFNTIGIVEYKNTSQAQTALKYLAYYKINYIMPIYLEFAPEQVFQSHQEIEENYQEKEEETIEVDKNQQNLHKTVFVKNLNFNTNEQMLELIFKNANLKSKILSVKIVRKSENQQSKGYGFVEMDSSEGAERAIKKLQNMMVDDHALKLSLAQKQSSISQVEQQNMKDKLLKKRKDQNEMSIAENDEASSNKLLVKNLAFEATASDVRELFKQFGALKKVRLPKKVNSTNHRGFGFVEFTTADEAKNAFKKLQNTHLYGRKIVIEWSLNEKGLEQDEQQNHQNENKKQKKQ